MGFEGGSALAQSPEAPARELDHYELLARGQTHAQLFRRALLPGPEGALVETDTALPVHQSVALRVKNVDTGLGEDSLDLELSAWGQTFFGDPGPERRVDGDLQTAFLRLRTGALTVSGGRQLVFGGAARMSRLDGLSAGVDFGHGFGAELYGGFTVLPRWNARRGYHYLGGLSRRELRNPELLDSLDRASHLQGGGKLRFSAPEVDAELSFHEEHERGGLARRNLGAAARVPATQAIFVSGDLVAELDARRIADARAGADFSPLDELDASLAYVHTEPALLLSRNSVLSVFSDASYEELGGSAVYRPVRRLRLEAEGAALFYELGHPGARASGVVRLVVDPSHDTVVRWGYTRLLAPDNGYHALRASAASRLFAALSATAEAYAYFYDESILGYRTSSVYAGTLSYAFSRAFDLLLGGSLARSPYAELDAQAELRLEYALDRSYGGLR